MPPPLHEALLGVDSLEGVLKLFARNWPLAHNVIFKNRHPNATPPFHDEIIRAWHSDHPKVETMAFRGAAKSTRAEEVIALRALYRLHRNFLIVGANFDRAADRLRAIKHELETNETIEALFGPQVGDTWQESKVVMPNGVVIQIVGQRQSLRGVKHNDARPDFLFIDDLEDPEDVRTPAARAALMKWVYGDLLPALEPNSLVRVAATPLDPEAWAVKNAEDPAWLSHVYPIETVDEDGARQATWPDRFPLHWIDKEHTDYLRKGQSVTWEQEYMCRAVDPATRTFTSEMIRVEPQVRSWHAVLAAYDPARTVNKTSAATGKAVGSWIGHRLVIWEAEAKLWKPDEITDDIFKTDEKFSPIAIGVEKDGLEEFLMQPLRAEQISRGYVIPVKPLKAPKGKLDFIGSLQPFFKAGEVIFGGSSLDGFQEAVNQLLSFPSGRIDFPNALAYLLTLRPGLPVYDCFNHRHLREDIQPLARTALFAAINAGNGVTTGILIEHAHGVINVLADALYEGDPGTTLDIILKDLALAAGRPFTIYAPRRHFDYDMLGMKAAARRNLIELRRGGDAATGREELRRFMGADVRGFPAFQISSKASWTLRGLAGGFARKPLHDMPEENIYRTVVEGLESFAAILQSARMQDDPGIVYEMAGGRRYISARPELRAATTETKR